MENKSGKHLEKLRGQIEFKNVSFSYPNRPDIKVLKDVSFSVPSGKTIAICGSSGAGKSTIVQLIQRFYDFDSGLITIDGEDIKGLDMKWLRSQMSLVSQEPVLFAMSIKENIKLGKLEASDEEIEEAAKYANAHSFITDLNESYFTVVGERVFIQINACYILYTYTFMFIIVGN